MEGFDPTYKATESAPVSTFQDLYNQAEVAKSVRSKKGKTYAVTGKRKDPQSVTIETEGATDVEITPENFSQYFGGGRRKTKRRISRRKRTMKRLGKKRQ